MKGSHRQYLAEFIGTFILVFCGTGAIIVDHVSNGVVTHLGIALTFGLVVLSIIYTIGDVSGAHINPAVTISFFVAGLFEIKRVLPYILSQILGAVIASFVLHLMFPGSNTLGETIPHGDIVQSSMLEFFLSFILMFVIVNTAHGSKETGIIAGIAIGATVSIEAIFGGPISGASMNPARSIAPALVSGNYGSLWIYLASPTIGMSTAVLAWKALRTRSVKESK